MKVYKGLSDAIVLPRCNTHMRYAKLNYRCTCNGVIYHEPICDICLYSRQYTVTQYPDLKPILHLLCSKYIKPELKTLQGSENGIT